MSRSLIKGQVVGAWTCWLHDAWLIITSFKVKECSIVGRVARYVDASHIECLLFHGRYYGTAWVAYVQPCTVWGCWIPSRFRYQIITEVEGQLHAPSHFTSGKNSPHYPLNRKLGGHQRQYGSFREDENVKSSFLFHCYSIPYCFSNCLSCLHSRYPQQLYAVCIHPSLTLLAVITSHVLLPRSIFQNRML
jgi:hypothetical protein